MPKADELTAIRAARDLEAEKADEVAWIMIEPYTPTPQLFFAMRELVRQTIRDRNNG